MTIYNEKIIGCIYCGDTDIRLKKRDFFFRKAEVAGGKKDDIISEAFVCPLCDETVMNDKQMDSYQRKAGYMMKPTTNPKYLKCSIST